MASPTTEVVVDPLAKGHRSQAVLRADGRRLRAEGFHAARQDIEIIVNRGGLIPHPIFDTQVAAMVCGFADTVSYDQLVSRTKSVQIDNRHASPTGADARFRKSSTTTRSPT